MQYASSLFLFVFLFLISQILPVMIINKLRTWRTMKSEFSLGHSQIFLDTHKFSWTLTNFLGHSQIFLDTHKFSWTLTIFLDTHKFSWTLTNFLGHSQIFFPSPQYSHIINKLLTSDYFRSQNGQNIKQGTNIYLIQRLKMHGATPPIPETPL